MTALPVDGSMVSLVTLVDWIAAGTNVSAERILRRRPFQICSGVRVGVTPGGLIGAVKAMLFVDDILRRLYERMNLEMEVNALRNTDLAIRLYLSLSMFCLRREAVTTLINR